MKFFHMADLHIGKIVNGYSMIDDQKALLDQTVQYLIQEAPQALILAGDIYDRRNPSVEAITLFDDFISKVVLELHIPVLAIGGNHDGGERLAFASHLLANAGFYMAGHFKWPLPQVVLEDEYGMVEYHFMSYADLSVIHAMVPETKQLDYAESMDFLLQQLDLDMGHRHILIAHGMVIGNQPLETSDSERMLSIGGTECWKSSALSSFDYVALGHLHRQQKTGAEHIRYAGSLMQYSFSEEHHEKVILSVTMDAKGQCEIEKLPLQPIRHLKTIRGTLKELVALPPHIVPYQKDYLRVLLEDKTPQIEPMQQLKQCFPYIMEMDYVDKKQTKGSSLFATDEAKDVAESMNPMRLFDNFYTWATSDTPSESMQDIMEQLFNEVEEQHQ